MVGIEFIFNMMNQEDAEIIAKLWHYNGIFSFYDTSADEEDYEEFIDPQKRKDNYYSVYSNSELIGFCSFLVVDDTLDLGLGLRPNLTGQGLGLSFMNAILAYIGSHYDINTVTLSVALFNERAIKVYEQAGFMINNKFIQETNGGKYEFVKMQLLT